MDQYALFADGSFNMNVPRKFSTGLRWGSLHQSLQDQQERRA